ncbi:hypothetical protein [Rhizobium sp. A37_96]
MALAIHVLLLMAIISVGGLHADSYPFAHATAIVTPTIRLISSVWWKNDAPWRRRWGEFEDREED